MAGQRQEWSREQLDVLKRTVAKGTSDDEFALFCEVCKATGLNPFAKQIYAIMRNQFDAELKRKVPRMTIQTAIDGFRLIAEMTALYAGQGPLEWCGSDGVWKDVWLSSAAPVAARATVYRKDWVQPMQRVALMSAYMQTKYEGGPTEMWSGGKGVGQLAKCAEALALRAAFPQNLSGLYTTEEMAQADNDSPIAAAAAQTRQLSDGAHRVVVDMRPAPARETVPARQQQTSSGSTKAASTSFEQDDEGPRFSPGFKDGKGALLSSADAELLTAYLLYLDGIPEPRIESRREALQATKDDAQRELARIIDGEAAAAEAALGARTEFDPETGEVAMSDADKIAGSVG